MNKTKSNGNSFTYLVFMVKQSARLKATLMNANNSMMWAVISPVLQIQICRKHTGAILTIFEAISRNLYFRSSDPNVH